MFLIWLEECIHVIAIILSLQSWMVMLRHEFVMQEITRDFYKGKKRADVHIFMS